MLYSLHTCVLRQILRTLDPRIPLLRNKFLWQFYFQTNIVYESFGPRSQQLFIGKIFYLSITPLLEVVLHSFKL